VGLVHGCRLVAVFQHQLIFNECQIAISGNTDARTRPAILLPCHQKNIQSLMLAFELGTQHLAYLDAQFNGRLSTAARLVMI
jgi:hypothetical protein